MLMKLFLWETLKMLKVMVEFTLTYFGSKLPLLTLLYYLLSREYLECTL